MHLENEDVYPNRLIGIRTVESGGLTKSQLIQKMQEHYIMINEYGEQLLTDNRFTTSDKKYSLQTVELTVSDLGFRDGATKDQIFKLDTYHLQDSNARRTQGCMIFSNK